MGTRWVLLLAGLVLFLIAACSSGESEIVVPADGLGTLQGWVKIGPICPVEPCSAEIGDTYSSRQLQLTSNETGDVVVHLNHDGTFNTEVPVGSYQVNLSDCIHLGCSSALPVAIEIIPGEVFELRIDIDTGIRSPVQPPTLKPQVSDGVSDNADATARRELSSRLGVAPGELMLVHSRQVEFSNGALGCPDAGMFYTEAIIPGFRLLYQVDATRYTFHVSADGRTFTDCRGENNVSAPFRLADEIVQVSDAFQLAGASTTHLGKEVVLRTRAEAEEYASESNGLIAIDSGLINWDVEILVGTVITGSGCSFDVVVPLVFLSHSGQSADVYVEAEQTGSCEKAWAQPVWLVLEEIPQSYSTGFTLSYLVK